MTLAFEPERGFGVYIHWPYCARICPYCDFNVYAAKTRDTAPLIEALKADLSNWRVLTGDREVTSVFFGGGTPSLISPDAVSDLIDHIGGLWRLDKSAEITLEANPDDSASFADFASAGVDRLSLGVQSLDDKALAFLGRNHNVDEARNAINAARGRFRSLSLDFIYALPGQNKQDWSLALNQALSLGADHLSLYELTIEQRTAFAKAVERGAFNPLDEDSAADLYELTDEITLAAGFGPYEISNYAGETSHQSTHNRIYWRSGDWLGVGPGAHGRLTLEGGRYATVAEMRPDAYIKDIGSAWRTREALSVFDAAYERLAMGLRLLDGAPRLDFEDLADRKIPEANIEGLVASGLLRVDADRLKLTLQGRLMADYVTRELVEGVAPD